MSKHGPQAPYQRRVPKPIYAGGLSQRDHAIQQAQVWMQDMALVNTPTPSREYLIIRDLVAALLARTHDA